MARRSILSQFQRSFTPRLSNDDAMINNHNTVTKGNWYLSLTKPQCIFRSGISRWGVSIIRLAAKRVQQPRATFLTTSQRDIRIVPFPPANNATRGLPQYAISRQEESKWECYQVRSQIFVDLASSSDLPSTNS
ncbi:hypothetical protein NPIL_53601 [Nephila pilipes]|uniref:Uncharacterized protein n=1 Tax=Nephila pilipes TaxID=299642 RepID=A0A8X6PD58_NEPPI|nr:hypothetical protein NPIL_53601 [Nephila pilipes]